jgi:hypothetical protein
MIRMLIVFFGLTGAFMVGIAAFRALSGKEKWELTKIALYAILCAFLSLVSLIGIVILF